VRIYSFPFNVGRVSKLPFEHRRNPPYFSRQVGNLACAAVRSSGFSRSLAATSA
jgi:hypothetical protein